MSYIDVSDKMNSDNWFMGKNMSIRTICILLLAAPVAIAQAAAESVSTTIYNHVSIIDGTGAPARPDMAIVIKGEQITDILPAKKIKPAENTDIIDGTGWYAVPGLIDSHVHMATSPDRPGAEAMLRRYLYSGITAARDMAGDVRALADLSRSALMKEIPSPDLYYVALMAGPSFFHDRRTIASARGATPGQVPWMQAISHDTNLPLAVAMARGTWATAIKIYANLPGDLITSITTEAHKQGIPVWAHAMVFPTTPGEVVNAGVDTMSHVCYMAYEGSGITPDGYHDRQQPDYSKLDPEAKVYRDLFRDMAAKNIVLDATLRIYAVQEKKGKVDENADFPYHCPTAFAARLTRLAFDSGVTVSAGTDGRTPDNDPFPALQEEIELLQNQVGLTPLQAIRAATYGSARAMSKEAEMGTIEKGKLANILFLNKNPAEDVANLRSVVTTIKRGTSYPRTDYTPIRKGEITEDQ